MSKSETPSAEAVEAATRQIGEIITSAPNVSVTTGRSEIAMAEALATRTPPTGLAAVMEQLTAADEDAMVIWTTKGPKNSHVITVSEVLAEIGGAKRSLIVKVYASGKSKVFIDSDLSGLLSVY